MSGAILVVDDEPAIRRLVRGALERAGHQVIEATTAAEALRAFDSDPAALLLDLGLPDRDGMELVPLAVKRGIPTLILSARDATAEKVAALDLGADDYVVKPFDTDELLARVRTALRHGQGNATSPAVLKAGDVEIDLERHEVRRGRGAVRLTPREFALLAELARHPGRVLTHSHLLRAVWGPAHDGDVEYLRVAVRALRHKLEDDPARPRLIRNEPAIGYRLTEIGDRIDL